MQRSVTVACGLLTLCALACGPASGGGPSAAGTMFVSQAGSSTVVAIDAVTAAPQARIDVGFLPHNLVPSLDGKTLYAVVVGSQTIAEIDTATRQLRRTFLTGPVPTSRDDGTVIQEHLDQDASAHTTCYDCHRPGGALPKYVGDRPFGLVLAAGGRQLVVCHILTRDVTVLDAATGTIVRTVRLDPSGEAREAVALAALEDALWVALRPRQPSTLPGALRRLDATTLAPLGESPSGSDTGSLLALPERASVLASNFETDTVTEHDESGGSRAIRAAPGPLGMLSLPDGRVLALDYYSNAISFLDLDGNRSETLPLALGSTPFVNPTQAALSGDQRSAWIVSSGTDGHLLQLDLASRSIVRDVPIDGLSFGVAFVPAAPR
jgi:DNA-binding beta-propeller fold protein YncE